MSKRRFAETLLDAASTLGGAKSGGVSRLSPLAPVDDQQRRSSLGIDALSAQLSSFSLEGTRGATPFGFGAGVPPSFMAKTLRERLQKHLGKTVSPPRPGGRARECTDSLALGSATYPGGGLAQQAKAYSRSPLGLAAGGAPEFAPCGVQLAQPPMVGAGPRSPAGIRGSPVIEFKPVYYSLGAPGPATGPVPTMVVDAAPSSTGMTAALVVQ